MIVLKGDDTEILSVNLEDILQKIRGIEVYQWKILWIDGVSHKLHMGNLVKAVNDSSDGLLIKSKKLLVLSTKFYQLYELILIGDKDQNKLHRLEDNDLKKDCEFFIELVDSSYWEITSKNKTFMDNIKQNFIFEEYE